MITFCRNSDYILMSIGVAVDLLIGKMCIHEASDTVRCMVNLCPMHGGMNKLEKIPKMYWKIVICIKISLNLNNFIKYELKLRKTFLFHEFWWKRDNSKHLQFHKIPATHLLMMTNLTLLQGHPRVIFVTTWKWKSLYSRQLEWSNKNTKTNIFIA